jgi:CTP-dependent riboflavin kinase
MTAAAPVLILQGSIRLSTEGVPRTAGRFNELINDNADVFRRYFGVNLFPGSLNIDVPGPASLQRDLDAGKLLPALVIPKTELINMPPYIGNGQAWVCRLSGQRFSNPVSCWVFRRIGSRVPPGVIEIVAPNKLRDVYGLQHGDKVTLDIYSRRRSQGSPVNVRT